MSEEKTEKHREREKQRERERERERERDSERERGERDIGNIFSYHASHLVCLPRCIRWMPYSGWHFDIVKVTHLCISLITDIGIMSHVHPLSSAGVARAQIIVIM